MQISELFLWGRDCLHFGNALLQGTGHLRAQPKGDKLPFLQESLCQIHRRNTGEEAPRQLLCLSLTLSFWTGLRINCWMPVKSKSSDTPGRCPRAGRCPVQAHFFQVCFFLHLDCYFSSMKSVTKESMWSAQMWFRTRRPQAGCILQHHFFEHSPRGGCTPAGGFQRPSLSSSVLSVWGFPRRKTVVVFVWTHHEPGEVTFPIGLCAQPLCKEVQPSDTAVLLHFHAN